VISFRGWDNLEKSDEFKEVDVAAEEKAAEAGKEVWGVCVGSPFQGWMPQPIRQTGTTEADKIWSAPNTWRKQEQVQQAGSDITSRAERSPDRKSGCDSDRM
jgi:hypothetical protein